MKATLVNIRAFFIILCITSYSVTTATPKTPPPTKVLSYNLDNNEKVHLTLSGTVYKTAGQKCLIRKEKEDGTDFEQMHPCEGSDRDHGTDRCLRDCSGDNIKLAFNVLSPRSKYLYVFSGNSAESIKDKNNGGNVFGLSIPLLGNPIVSITTDANKKLKLAAKTCVKVDCPIFYGSVKYAPGTAGTTCVLDSNDNSVGFDAMIPYYEMRCTKYPIFIYKMPNFYMKKTIDIYKPQYYVTYKENNEDKKKYLLKFTNAFPAEICRFSIKDAATTAADSTKDYSSLCGDDNSKGCYAPCNNVELILSISKPIVKILIQTRHHDLQQTVNNYDGYEEEKFAIVEPANTRTVLKAYSTTGVTINRLLYNPNTNNDVKFNTCTLKHFPADIPRPTAGTVTNCQNSACENNCSESTTIGGLLPGKPYIIEITADAITNYSSVKEYLFFKTNKADASKFVEKAPAATDVSAIVKAIDGTVGTDINEPTCSYFFRKAGKGPFVDAECEDSIPCKGFCKDNKKFINLNPKTNYDIKVVANRDYGEKIFENVATTLSTLELTHNFLDKGFQVIGTLTSAYPEAVCHYKIKEKKDSTSEVVYSCPTVVSTSQVVNTKVAASTNLKLSQTENMKVARAGSGGDVTSSSSHTQQSTKQSKFSACSQAPSCSNIVISEGYEAEKEYQVTVIAVDRSEEVSIDIPKNLLEEDPTDETLKIRVVINRGVNILKVTSILPNGKDDSSLCKWILRDTMDPALPIVKKCNSDTSSSCILPTCKSFTIEGVTDDTDYHLLVIHSKESTVRGVGKIKEGETSNESRANQTMIIGIIAPIAVVALAIGIYFGFKKKND